MLSMLLAYDAEGRVIETLDYAVVLDDERNAIGLVDFETVELMGRQLTDVWRVERAVGSGTWPEWLGSRAHMFRVERTASQPHRITALVHVGVPAGLDEDGITIPAIPASGHRRERAQVEAMITERIVEANLLRDTDRKLEAVADIRDIVGGPDRPLLLDDEGRTKARVPVKRPDLPLIRSEPDTIPTPPAGPSDSSTPGQERTPSR